MRWAIVSMLSRARLMNHTMEACAAQLKQGLQLARNFESLGSMSKFLWVELPFSVLAQKLQLAMSSGWLMMWVSSAWAKWISLRQPWAKTSAALRIGKPRATTNSRRAERVLWQSCLRLWTFVFTVMAPPPARQWFHPLLGDVDPKGVLRLCWKNKSRHLHWHLQHVSEFWGLL